jgi:hypothetical protein
MEKYTPISENYYRRKIIGDGHCFVHCYLTVLSKTYKEAESNREMTNIARKFRIDFANYLLQPSPISDEKLSEKINIDNPSIISNFFEYVSMDPLVTLTDKEKSSQALFEALKERFYNIDYKNDEKYESEIYNFYETIYIFSLQDEGTNKVLFLKEGDTSFENIQRIFKRDPRYNAYLIDKMNNEDLNMEIYGIGNVPLNINYYYLLPSIVPDYSGDGGDFTKKAEIKKIIERLCSQHFLEYPESILIARYIGVNITVYPLNSNYKKPFNLIEANELKESLNFINDGREGLQHWELIGWKDGDDDIVYLMKLSDETKTYLYEKLVEIEVEKKSRHSFKMGGMVEMEGMRGMEEMGHVERGRMIRNARLEQMRKMSSMRKSKEKSLMNRLREIEMEEEEENEEDDSL